MPRRYSRKRRCTNFWILLIVVMILVCGIAWYLGMTPARLMQRVNEQNRPDLNGYLNSKGNYGFNYPDSWHGMENCSSAQFTYENAKMDIVFFSGRGHESLNNLVAESQPFDGDVNLSQAEVGGEQAVRQDLLGRRGVVLARAYHLLHNGDYYIISLVSNPNDDPGKSFKQRLEGFEIVIQSFRFLDQ